MAAKTLHSFVIAYLALNLAVLPGLYAAPLEPEKDLGRAKDKNTISQSIDWLDSKLGYWGGAKLAAGGLAASALGTGVVFSFGRLLQDPVYGAGAEAWVRKGDILCGVGKFVMYTGVIVQIVQFFRGSPVGAAELPPDIDAEFFLIDSNQEIRYAIFNAFVTKDEGDLLEFYDRLMLVISRTPYHVEQYVMAEYINSILLTRHHLDRSVERGALKEIFRANETNGINEQLRTVVTEFQDRIEACPRSVEN